MLQKRDEQLIFSKKLPLVWKQPAKDFGNATNFLLFCGAFSFSTPSTPSTQNVSRKSQPIHLSRTRRQTCG